MATNLDRLRSIQVSAAAKESDYDTARAVDSMIRFNAGVMPNDEVQTVNDQDLIGGTEEASDAELLVQSLALPFAQNRVKPHTLAFTAAYALGGVAVTTPSGATDTRKHTFTPQASAAQPSFTLEGLMKTGVQLKYSGLFIDSFGLTFQRSANRYLNLSGQAYGSGTQVAGTATESEIVEGGLNAANAAVWFDNTTYEGSTGDDLDLTDNELTSNPTADSANIVSLDWQYRNNMDTDFLYEVGSGEQFGGDDRLARDQTVTLVRLYQDETYRAYATDQTEVALQCKVKGALIETGFYYGMNLIFPLLQIQDRDVSEQGGRMIETIVFYVLEDSTYGSVTLDVFNVQAAYAA